MTKPSDKVSAFNTKLFKLFSSPFFSLLFYMLPENTNLTNRHDDARNVPDTYKPCISSDRKWLPQVSKEKQEQIKI